jgi:broad specificity phosphatase PhoE
MYQRFISSFTSILLIGNTFTNNNSKFQFLTSVKALSSTAKPTQMTQPNVWRDYKKTLIEAGVLDLQQKRPIGINAINIGTSAENAMLSDDSSSGNENDSADSNTVTKIIHFQRHGQGYHNLLGDVVRASGMNIDIDDPNPDKNPFVKPEIQDSPLTMKGRSEATSRRIQASMLNPQLIIVSPLVRALQTALLSFTDHIQNEDEDKNVPFIAHEGCREQLGLLTCNKALPLSQTKVDYPQVDFSLVSHGESDPLWEQYETREEPLVEAERAYDFLTKFVMEREEAEIAIVCHSAWLFSVCNAVIDCGGDESLESWFGTGEIRSLRVTFTKR